MDFFRRDKQQAPAVKEENPKPTDPYVTQPDLEPDQQQIVGKMSSGDYTIHIYIQEGAQFKLEGCDTVNPIVEISCCGKTEYSKCLKDVACDSDAFVCWSEHVFFEPKQMKSEDISIQTISIKVKNRGLFRDELIGVYDFDITTIYFAQNHTIQHQWIALNNPEAANYSELTGILRLSLSVQGEGDNQIPLQDSEEAVSTSNMKMLISSSIKKRFKQLTLQFLRAEHLPKLDQFGTIDAYCKMTFGGVEYRTHTVKQENDETNFHYEWKIPIQWPATSDRMVLSIWDEDKVVDEAVGSIIFSLRELVKKGSQDGGSMHWVNVYGAPVDQNGEWSTVMNNNPELASTWKGRLLLNVICADISSPVSEQKLIDHSRELKIARERKLIDKQNRFQILAQVGIGCQLPGADEEYRVRIQIADCQLETAAPKEHKKSYCRWHQRLPDSNQHWTPKILETNYTSVEMMGKIHVYLMLGESPICFWSGAATDFVESKAKHRWIILQADKSLGKIENDYEAGMVQIKLSIIDLQRNKPVDFMETPGWIERPPKRMKQVVNIFCMIFQCKDLPSAEKDGLSDPYISVWNQNGDVVRTNTIQDSINPIFYEVQRVIYQYTNVEDAPPIILNVFDHNTILKDVYLGRAVIKLTDAATNDFPHDGFRQQLSDEQIRQIPKPKWHPIHLGNDESQPMTGQVLCSFLVTPGDQVFSFNHTNATLRRSIERKDFNIDINVFGLRELQSFGLMPIRKPYIKFHVKSLMDQKSIGAATNIMTKPCHGPNPNFNTMITFSCKLPVESVYCPSLTCDVHDYIFLGASQPRVGTFVLDLGQIKVEKERKMQVFRARFDQIAQHLDEFLLTNQQQLSSRVQKASTIRDSALDKLVKEKQQLILTRQSDAHRDFVSSQKTVLASSTSPNAVNQIIGGDSQLEMIQRTKTQQYEAFDDEDPPIDGNQPPALSQGNKEEPQEIRDKKKELRSTQIELMKMQKVEKGDENVFLPSSNPSSAFLTASIKNGLLKKETELKLEIQELEKDHKTLQRHAEVLAQQEVGNYAPLEVLMPKYRKNEELQVYQEIDKPSEDLYIAVGFNDQDTIKEILTGQDDERRQTLKRGVTTIVSENDRSIHQRMWRDSNKHYRKFHLEELENRETFKKHMPFISIPIKRGATRGVEPTIFGRRRTDLSGELSNEREVGRFKGMVDLFNEQERVAFEKDREKAFELTFQKLQKAYHHYYQKDFPYTKSVFTKKSDEKKMWSELGRMSIKIDEIRGFFADLQINNQLKVLLQKQSKCNIRLYVLGATDLAARDLFSASDAYLRVTCGEVISKRDEYHLNESSPHFDQSFNFQVMFPGAPTLQIEVMDYDDLFGDDLIGRTSIDLDDRYFNLDWRKQENKPIETRQLKHESSALSQGALQCWVEITDSSKKNDRTKEWSLAKEPTRKYQLRVCVYNTLNVPCEDIEGTSDVYITAYIEQSNKFKTDTHFRCQNGKASFNYRLLFDFEAPRKDCLLVLQAWDRDLLKRDDYICEWTLDLGPVLHIVQATQREANLSKRYHDRNPGLFEGHEMEYEDPDSFWLVTHKEGKDIKVRLDVKLMPMDKAEQVVVGKARSEPNMEPYLPPPVGRISFSLNPCKMLTQLVAPEFLCRVISALFCIVCIALCVMMLPMIASQFITEFVKWAI